MTNHQEEIAELRLRVIACVRIYLIRYRLFQFFAEHQLAELRLRELKAKVQLFSNLWKQLLADCPDCGNKRILLDWNSKLYLLQCNTFACKRYRQPVESIHKEDLRLLFGKEVN